MFLPKRRSTIAELQLQKANDGLRTEIVNLRHELTNKQGYAERLERIDELTATIDQLRERNKRLEAEAKHLAKIAANRPADHPTHLGNILRVTATRSCSSIYRSSDCTPWPSCRIASRRHRT